MITPLLKSLRLTPFIYIFWWFTFTLASSNLLREGFDFICYSIPAYLHPYTLVPDARLSGKRVNQMPGPDKRKQSLYFPEDMLKEIQNEANRQDRSLSWVVQQAWRIARSEIKKFPSVNDVLEPHESDDA